MIQQKVPWLCSGTFHFLSWNNPDLHVSSYYRSLDEDSKLETLGGCSSKTQVRGSTEASKSHTRASSVLDQRPRNRQVITNLKPKHVLINKLFIMDGPLVASNETKG